MMRFIVCLYILAVSMLYACKDPATGDYRSLVKKELGKNKREDSLFMEIKFGMTAKAFYAYCWAMNKKGLFMAGTNNASVLYKLDKELDHPVTMNFSPGFYHDSIYTLAITFAYDAWAPWNHPLSSDSLIGPILRLCRKWYPGNDFLTMTDPKKGTIYIKVDGNRRIIVGRYDDQYVKVDYTDLLIEPAIKK